MRRKNEPSVVFISCLESTGPKFHMSFSIRLNEKVRFSNSQLRGFEINPPPRPDIARECIFLRDLLPLGEAIGD